jgi:hypothetical protein
MRKTLKKKIKKRSRRVYRGGNHHKTPVFIMAYNQYTYVKSMVDQLMKYPNLQLYIIDNKSTYPPLVEYLKTIDGKHGVKVLYQDKNYGHKVYERPDIIALGGDKYIVTDPDLLLNDKLPHNFVDILSELSDQYKTNKIGFALDIKNNIDMSKFLDSSKTITIDSNEAKYWKDRIEHPTYELYKAPIDTTFSLINKKYYKPGKLDDSIRIAGNFTSVHRPWLNNMEQELLPGELDYYLNKDNISTTLNRWHTV